MRQLALTETTLHQLRQSMRAQYGLVMESEVGTNLRLQVQYELLSHATTAGG